MLPASTAAFEATHAARLARAKGGAPARTHLHPAGQVLDQQRRGYDIRHILGLRRGERRGG